MLATPAGELHVVALRMVDNLLGEAGYDVVMLGPDVPAADLAAAAGRHEPDVICLSATMPGGTDRMLLAIDEVQQVPAADELRDRRPRAELARALRARDPRLRAASPR